MVHSLIYCNQFSCHFGEMWFLTAFPVVCVPVVSRRQNYGSFFKKHNLTNRFNSLTCTVSSLVRTSPLAAITVVGLLDVLMVFNSAELRSLLLTICILALESPQTLFPPDLLLTQPEYPFLCGKVECSLVVRFELVNVFSKILCLASGTSLLSFSLFVGPVLKFHRVETSLMKRFDMYFSKRWSSLVSTGLFVSLRTNASQSCETQPNCGTIFTMATAFLSSLSSFVGVVAFLWLFCLVVNNLMMREQTLIHGFAPNTCLTWRGLCESNSLHCVQDFLHRVSPKLLRSLRIECI